MEIAAQHGADHLIDYSTESIRDRVKDLVGGADVVFDPVGGDVFTQSLRCINGDGRLVIIGFAGGTIQQIPSNYLLVKNVSAVGLAMGAYRLSDPSVVSNAFEQLWRWYEAGKLRPNVSHTFPLAETADALDILLKRKVLGKVVVTVR